MTTQTLDILTPKTILLNQYPILREITEEHEKEHWIPEEADLRTDVEQWRGGKILEEEKRLINMILRLFTQADSNISMSYVEKLIPMFKDSEARMMLLSFAARETTHVLAYKKLNDTLGYDSQEFLSEFLQFEEMKSKHEFMIENTPLETDSDKALYVAKQALMEGVNLFGSFSMLLSFAPQGKLPGMISINKWSAIEESMHVRGLSELFKILIKQNPKIVTSEFKQKIYETAREIIRMEEAFIDLCFSVGSTTTATAQQFKDYVRYICDYRMQKELGLKAQFGVKENPIPWMDLILSNVFSNFFEATTTEYSKGNLTGEWVY